MRKACELIEQNQGVHFDLGNVPYRHREDDAEYDRALDAAFELMSRGETSGVFQVEGSGMTRVLTEMKPTRFEHIIAAISLFRPGPLEYIPTYIRRMHGEEDIAYHHPLLEPFLSETYGIIVYQEQIMQIASELFSYSLGDADLMRRAVSKKKEKDLLKHRSIFQRNGPAHDISEEVAGKIFDDIEFFARYGFNKSHAADYAVLTVQTAYLKAHYPHEYMAAVLTIERHDTAKVGGYINDCRRMGIPILPPEINTSGHDFIIETQTNGTRTIRYGLSAIKNVGEGSVEVILKARGRKPFTDIADFCERVDLRVVGKRALECLIKVGALDTLGPRLKLLASLDRMLSVSVSHHKAAEIGQMSLFGETTGVGLNVSGDGLLVQEVQEEISQRDLLQWERELVGVYVSEHPLQSLISRLRDVITAYSNQLSEADHDRQVTMAGTVTSVRRHVSKSGKTMAFAEIEDLYGPMEVVIWPRTWDETQDLWETNRVLLVRGRIDALRGEPKLLCDEATTNFEFVEAVPHPTTPARAWTVPISGEFDDDNPPPDLGRVFASAVPSDVDALDDDNGDQTVSELVESAKEPNRKGNAGEFQGASPAGAAGLPLLNENQAPPYSEGACVKLKIFIPRSGEAERDKRRIERVYGELTSHPGDDIFSFILVGSDGSQVEIEFPDDTTRYCDALVERVTAILGENAIQVDVMQD
jgi:DNA polymerase-3 subunit alpha